MALDVKKAEQFLKTANDVLIKLEEKEGNFFDSESLYEFKKRINAFENNILAALDDSRELRVGIVGAVKAGKSSFLNACIFNGEDYLPKAATPMTAALTRITYSETPKAIVHFYTDDDWNEICKYADDYDVKLKKEYEKYCSEFKEQQRQYGILNKVGKPAEAAKAFNPVKPFDINAFEKELKQRNVFPDHVLGSKQLVEMVKSPDILTKLGHTDEIKGDIFNKLNNYVGAEGKYTPIVSYVELQVDNEYVKDMEIVDTPGLNDPIASRGMVTKNFLTDCDVVLVLAPCSQFVQEGTISLITNTLPATWVKDISVIGTKLDSGIMDKPGGNFVATWKQSLYNYRRHLDSTMSSAKAKGGTNCATEKINGKSALFVSAMCYSIYQKLKNKIKLNEEENHIYQKLKNDFTGFEDNMLSKLSGIGDARNRLIELLNRKEELIAGRNDELLCSCRIDLMKILEKILSDVVSGRAKLESNDAEDLKKRYDKVISTLDLSRRKLSSIFETAALESEKRAKGIESRLAAEIPNYSIFKTSTCTHESVDTYKTGFLGLRREIVKTTITDHSANTADVKNNIQGYIAKCSGVINNEFNYIINRENLTKRIKDIVLEAFSGSDYDESDILIPLETVMARIEIPNITVTADEYIDKINSAFPSGAAVNDSIHKLSSLQSDLLGEACDKIKKDLSVCVENINTILNTQAATFADEISGKISGELERLQKQMAEKKRYLEEYAKFADELRGYKKALS